MFAKRLLKGAVACVLAASMLLAAPASVSLAAEKVSSLYDIVKIIREKSMADRNPKFAVTLDPNMDIDGLADHLFVNQDVIDGMLSMWDDPSTPEDADYLVGNYDWTHPDDVTIDENYDLKFDLHYFETLPQTQYVNEHAPQILAQIGVDGMTNYQKVKAIHDWIAKKVVYTNTKQDVESTAYGAMYDGKVLCNGYSLCLYRLLVEAGIPCKYIGGKAGTGRDAEGHAWNIVALGDKWYNVDLTWDDDEDAGVCYDYFLKGSSDFDEADPSQKHEMDYGYTTFFAEAFPIATSAFNPKLMSDENTVVKIGSNLGDVAPETPDASGKTYEKSDIVDGTYPENMKFTVKRNKMTDLQLFIAKGMDEVIDKVTYSVKTGKSRIKKIKNYGIMYDEGTPFTDLELYGKKKGKVSINIILTLINGQKLTFTFSGKVK